MGYQQLPRGSAAAVCAGSNTSGHSRLETARRLAMRQRGFQSGWMGIESTGDLQTRQGLLQIFKSSIGDLGSVEKDL
jgi:hypothetical protein